MIWAYLFVAKTIYAHFMVAKTIYAFFCSKRFTHFVWKVFVCWKLPSGKFRLFGPLMITFKKDKQSVSFQITFKNKSCGGKNASIVELRNHTHVQETSAEICLIAKTTGAAWHAVSSIYQIARPDMTFLAQLFLELWDIILSHHYDTLIDKSFISWWFRFVKFQILARFLFLSPFEGRAGPPGSSSCLTNLFWKIFKAPRWSPSTRPMIRSPRRPLLQIQWRVFLNEQNTEARQPVLLVEMIPKVESEVFAQWRDATTRFFP